ncbi:MAG: glycosyltransferase [Treponema sp.]|nr:glycosyltransferase [Treponema sp.]
MFLSIITVNYNNKEGLRKTLQSIVSQTCGNYEHIIIDGGSTDGSVDVIHEFLQNENYAKHVTHWSSEKDDGIYNAMNKGIVFAKGDYCLLLNSGDVFVNHKCLQKACDCNSGEDIFYFNVKIIYPKKIFKLIYPDTISARFFFEGKTLNHQSILIKTSLQKRYPYSEKYKIVSDVDFLMKAFVYDHSTYKHVNDFLVLYDATEGLSSSPKTRDLFWAERKILFKKRFPSFFYDDYVYYSKKIIYYAPIISFLRKIKHRLEKLIYQGE